jgi:hypothetical protein
MTTIHQTAGARLVIAGLALFLGLGFLTSCGSDDEGGGDPGASSSGGGQGAAESEGGTSQSAGTDKGDNGDKGDKGDDGADVESGDADGDTDSAAPSDDAADADETGSDDAEAGDDGSTPAATEDPNSPFVVAAAAVGTRSRDSVVTLHALGVSTTSAAGVPHQLLPDQGKKLRGALREQVVEASRLTPPKGSAAARLVTSLNAYSRAAGQLAKWAPDGGPLPTVWFHRLGKADRTWLKALRDLSDEAGQDLLQDLPELLMPAS